MRKRRWVPTIFGFVVMLVALAIAACTPAAAPTPTPTAKPAATTPSPALAASPTTPARASPAPPTPRPVSLKFGTIQATSDAGVYVAAEKGYFKEQGIDLEVVNFPTVGELIAPLGTGQLDLIGLPLSSALLNAADRGVSLKIVADKGQDVPGAQFTWVMLRKDLADSGQVKAPADLRGMKVAIPAKENFSALTVQLMLKEAGLRSEDVEIVVLPPPQMGAALGNKGIAAAATADPYVTTAVQQGLATKWIPQSRYFGGRAQIAFIVFGSKLLQDRDLAQRWMVAYLQGVRGYQDALRSRAGRDEVTSILAKYTPVKDRALYDAMELPILDPNGSFDMKSVDIQQKWFVEEGFYKGNKTIADIIDSSFAEYAVGKLGKR